VQHRSIFGHFHSSFVIRIACVEGRPPLIRRAVRPTAVMPWRPLSGSGRDDTVIFAGRFWNLSSHQWDDHRSVPGVALPPPRRLLAVFGAESSGTKMLARLLAHAAGVSRYGLWDGTLAVRNMHTEVHHFSLPWGGTCEQLLHEWPVKPLDALRLTAPWPHAPRFFVHPASHIRAYAADGTIATAVLVHREPIIALLSKQTLKVVSSTNNAPVYAAHCRNASAARLENALAYELMRKTLEQLPPAHRAARAGTANRLLVSYEALSTLQTTYIRDLLSNLDVRSWDGFVPPLDNANAPYVRSLAKDSRLPGAGIADLQFDLLQRKVQPSQHRPAHGSTIVTSNSHKRSNRGKSNR
jgi:hypothetical protein